MKLLKVHVLTEEDREWVKEYNNDGNLNKLIENEEVDWNYDYAQTALIDAENFEVLIWNDNIHSHIDSDISNFINGIKYAGINVEIEECVMMSSDLIQNYSGVRY